MVVFGFGSQAIGWEDWLQNNLSLALYLVNKTDRCIIRKFHDVLFVNVYLLLFTE